MENVDMKKQYDSHGGNIYKEAKKCGIRAEEILDYSANINPLGVPEYIKERLQSNIDKLVHYPDPECTELKEEIAKYLSVPCSSILVGNGASEIIYLLLDVLRPKKLLIPAPTFSEYAKAAQIFGIKVEYYRRKEENGFTLNVEEFVRQMDADTEAIILCNPNNPTSTLVGREDLTKLIEYCSQRGIWVIIDEAFIELTVGGNHNSIVDAVASYKNLFIVRAFTKLFAIPGLRIGYGIGSKSIIKRMEEKKIPWSVNSFASSVGGVLTREMEYMDKTAQWLKVELKWFFHELCKLKHIKVYEPSTNFVLAKIMNKDLDAGILRERLLENGILIRHAGNFEFLHHQFFRMAVKDRTSNLHFTKVLKEVLGEKGDS